ncbi:methyltransferase type 11 [Calothrix sp. 336/3]|uniref:methyltransferase type 11 n=1 Tax=Calothrix sp. 336/3 TaxID=1337936 RepID=UPI0004E38253|nr:methyltransferase type 11 [Calothrix sp. 336/3]AKG19919.1 methyltransferase type 11 [Calothrix sp. 336/3]
MLREEANWLGSIIYSLDAGEVFPILNIGSSNQDFREKVQPWIDELLFKPGREQGYSIIHCDMKDDAGVDLVGDFNNPLFLQEISQKNIQSILCSNLLEHLTNREEICQTMSSLIPINGYLFVTVPYRFPYHRDPIDTMFRPSVEELRQLFPDLEIVQGEIVSGGMLLQSTSVSPILYLLVMCIRLILPVYQPLRWLDSLRYSLWLFQEISATCVVFKRIS